MFAYGKKKHLKTLLAFSCCFISRACFSLKPRRMDNVLNKAPPASRTQLGPSPWKFLEFWALGAPFVLGFIFRAGYLLEQRTLKHPNMTYIDKAQKFHGCLYERNKIKLHQKRCRYVTLFWSWIKTN